MLTLTPNAEQAVRKLVADSPISEMEGGLRIAPGQPTPEGVPLELSIVGSPEPDDKDAGAPDAHVYLEPTAAEALDDLRRVRGRRARVLRPPSRPIRAPQPCAVAQRRADCAAQRGA